MGQLGIDHSEFGSHSIRGIKAKLIYEQTKNLFTLQLLLGHSKPGLTDYYWFSAEFTLVSEADLRYGRLIR